jgi:hypothetical protein
MKIAGWLAPLIWIVTPAPLVYAQLAPESRVLVGPEQVPGPLPPMKSSVLKKWAPRDNSSKKR